MTDNTPSPVSRLTRLLHCLSTDADNTMLLSDALQTALETPDVALGEKLLDHLEAHPGSLTPPLQAHASHLALQLGLSVKATTWGEQAIANGIDHPAVIYNTAYAAFLAGKHARTAELVTQLHESVPPSPESLLLLSRALHHLEQYEQAGAIVADVADNHPDLAEARGLLALIQYDAGDLTNALRNAHETLAHDPDQLDALLACAGAHAESGNRDAALMTWRHTTAVHPTCGRAWSGLAQIEFSDLQHEDAEAHLRTAVQYMPNHIGTWHLLAWIHILKQDARQARKALEQAYAIDRNFGDTHGGLAVVDAMEGHDEAARAGIKRALKLAPEGMAARYAEMLLLLKAGRESEAYAVIERVMNAPVTGSQITGRDLVQQWLAQRDGSKPASTSRQH